MQEHYRTKYIDKGLTKPKLCGIVLFKLDTIFFHVFCVLTGLLYTDSTHSYIPGDQGGSILFQTNGFFLALIFVQIGLLQFVVYCSIFAK